MTKKQIRIIHRPGASSQADTLVTLYDRSGNITSGDLKNSYHKLIYIVKTKTVDSTNAYTHKKDIFSDSSETDRYIYRFMDSMIYISKRNDKLQYHATTFLKNGKPFKSFVIDSLAEQVRIYFIKIGQLLKKSYQLNLGNDGSTDSAKHVYNKLTRIKKSYAFNPTKKCWFVQTKEISRNRRHTLIETVYREDLNLYIKTISKRKYNKHGQIISQTEYDSYKRRLTEKILYYYEYY